MGDIILCNQPLRAAQLQSQCGIAGTRLFSSGRGGLDMLEAFTPYLTNPEPSLHERLILNRLTPKPVSRELTRLCSSFGSDTVLALAEWRETLQQYSTGLIGTSTTAYANRMGEFGKALERYQRALLAYRQQARTGSPLAHVAKQRAHSAHSKLQVQFGNELRAITSRVKARRGSALTDPERATNIARSSRNATSLNVTTQAQAHQLVKLTSHARVLSNGLAVIDFGSRIGTVHNSYQAGGNWEREMFIESSSFALSTTLGALAVRGGMALLAVATPMGWVLLLGAGATISLVAAGAAVGVNHIVKEEAGGLYDSVMEWLRNR